MLLCGQVAVSGAFYLIHYLAIGRLLMCRLDSGINPLASKFELQHYFKVATPKIVVADALLVDNVRHALTEINASPLVVVIEDGSQAAAHGQPIVSPPDTHCCVCKR